jgi:type I restriction enzyme S subunit
MEVKPGYKQTEVGVIPNDWDVKPLGDAVDFLDGRRRPVKDSDRAKMRGDIPYYGASGIVDYVNAFLFNEELILLGEDGENILSRNCRLAFKIKGKTWVNNHAHVLKPKPGMSLDYLAEFLESRDYAQYNTGTAQPKLNKFVCSGIPVVCPPPPEQRAIAGALSDVDALLGGLDQLIAKKRDLKQAAMQQLLTGKHRLAGFRGEWAVKRIGEFTDCTSGGTPSTLMPSYWGGSIPWMSSGELNLKIVAEVEGRITEDGLNNSSTKMIPKKCVLIGLAGQGKTRGTVAMNLIELCTNQSIAAIFPSPAFVPEYLYYNLDTRYDELRGLSTGDGGRGGLNLTIIKSMPVPLPTVAEQTAIAEVLTNLDAELAALEQRRAKTRALKQGMMQELLTGKTRLVCA